MTCKNINDQLYEYLTGRLDGAARNEVAKHLDACTDCRNKGDALKITLDILDQAQPYQPPADFNDRVMRSIQEQKALKKAQTAQSAKILQFSKRERFEPSKYFDDLPMVVNRGGGAPSAAENTARAVNLYNQGTLAEDLDEKEKLFLEALQAGCTDKKILAKICNNLADCYERLGRLDESIAAYAKAVELDSEIFIAFLSLGDVCKIKGSVAEALHYYEKALEIMVSPSLSEIIDPAEINKTKDIIDELRDGVK